MLPKIGDLLDLKLSILKVSVLRENAAWCDVTCLLRLIIALGTLKTNFQATRINIDKV